MQFSFNLYRLLCFSPRGREVAKSRNIDFTGNFRDWGVSRRKTQQFLLPGMPSSMVVISLSGGESGGGSGDLVAGG